MTTKRSPAPAVGASGLVGAGRQVLVAPWVRWIALLALCAAYLQGGLDKAMDFDAAVGEMKHFGLSPPAPLAAAVLLLELGGSVMILVGWYRWLAAGALGVFTLFATFVASRFWELPPSPERFMAENGFFEHLGLVGGFLLVAWHDLRRADDDAGAR